MGQGLPSIAQKRHCSTLMQFRQVIPNSVTHVAGDSSDSSSRLLIYKGKPDLSAIPCIPTEGFKSVKAFAIKCPSKTP